jgi:hypothetical protein
MGHQIDDQDDAKIQPEDALSASQVDGPPKTSGILWREHLAFTQDLAKEITTVTNSHFLYDRIITEVTEGVKPHVSNGDRNGSHL